MASAYRKTDHFYRNRKPFDTSALRRHDVPGRASHEHHFGLRLEGLRALAAFQRYAPEIAGPAVLLLRRRPLRAGLGALHGAEKGHTHVPLADPRSTDGSEPSHMRYRGMVLASEARRTEFWQVSRRIAAGAMRLRCWFSFAK